MGSKVWVCIGVALVAAVAGTADAATPAPRLQSASVVGDRVTVAFTAPLAATGGRITVTVNGKPVTPSRATRSGRRLVLVLPRPAYSDDVVRVHGLNLRTSTGRRIPAFAATTTNRSTAGCTQEIGVVTPGARTEGPTDPNAFLRGGRLSVLDLWVDYADAPTQSFHRRFPFATSDAVLREASYGKASLDVTQRDAVVRMPKRFVDYAFRGAWADRKPFFQDLVLKLDPEVDFSRFDVVVLTTMMTPASRPPNWLDSAPVAPPGEGIVADGKELRHFGVFQSNATPSLGMRAMLVQMGIRPWRRSAHGMCSAPSPGTAASSAGWIRRRCAASAQSRSRRP